MMKALIVEDEKLAAENLLKILNRIGNVEVIALLESISDTIEWLRQNGEPEILFLDIQLGDGTAFELFEKLRINCPVIFTTAYDEYAIKAFKVNSVDYLLKPLEINDVKKAIEKYNRLTINFSEDKDLNKIISYFKKNTSYKSSFLIPVKGDKLIPLNTDNIIYFYIDFGNIKAITFDGKSFVMDKTLDEISEMINPDLFFRANRQYIISRKGIKDVDFWFNQRLSVNLIVNTPEKIIISKAKIIEFKSWFTKG